MHSKRSESTSAVTFPAEHHDLHRRMAEVLAPREKVTSLEKVGKEPRESWEGKRHQGKHPRFDGVPTETGAMMSHIEQTIQMEGPPSGKVLGRTNGFSNVRPNQR